MFGRYGKFSKIKSNSQDIVFSAWAILYCKNLLKCFKEIKRVLKKKGVLIFSLGHPFWRVLDKKTLKLKRSYFKSGKYGGESKKGFLVWYDFMMSEIINSLIDSGLILERVLEPDSRKRYKEDYWYESYPKEKRNAMKFLPRTIIFKARKT